MLLSRGSPGTIWKAERFQVVGTASQRIQAQKQEFWSILENILDRGELTKRRPVY